jgi:hypothetical protein
MLLLTIWPSAQVKVRAEAASTADHSALTSDPNPIPCQLIQAANLMRNFCRPNWLVGRAPLPPNRGWTPLSRKRFAGHSEPVDVPQLSLFLDHPPIELPAGSGGVGRHRAACLPLPLSARGPAIARSRKLWLSSTPSHPGSFWAY